MTYAGWSRRSGLSRSASTTAPLGRSSTVDATVGSFPISFSSVSSGTVLSAFGYPAAAPWDGKQLAYSRGPVSFDTLNGSATYGMTSNLTGGASGGPWVLATNYTTYGDASIRSLNSYKYNFNKNAMYGPKFNSSTGAVFNAADAGGAPAGGSGVSFKDLP